MEILENAVSENVDQSCRVTVSQLLNEISVFMCVAYIGVCVCVKCWLGGMDAPPPPQQSPGN